MKEERFASAVNEYLSNLESVGASPKTIENYGNRIQYFHDYLMRNDGSGELNDPTPENIRGWRDSLLHRGLKKSTVKQYLVELKAFFETVCDDDFTSDPLAEKCPVSRRMMPSTKRDEEKPYEHILDAGDIAKLWANECPIKQLKPAWARNYAMVVLLIDSKIRNSELLNLRLCDVDLEYGECRIVRGKGGKYRIVTLDPISVSAIKLYLLSGLRPADATDDDYLFVTTGEQGVFGNSQETKSNGQGKTDAQWHKGTRQWLSALVERHVQNVTGKTGFRSHSLRHAGSAVNLSNGMSIERIQSELGHASVATTEIYAGKLPSIRRQKDFEEVEKMKHEWAERNMEMVRLLTA